MSRDKSDKKNNTGKKGSKKGGQKKQRKRFRELLLRNTRLDDYDDIARLMDRICPEWEGAWTREQFESQIRRFPEGQICIEDNGAVVAASNALIVNMERFGDRHTCEEITGNGYFNTHDPNDDTLYGADIFVNPDYRDLRLGRRLYDARKTLCENLNLRRIVAGGRDPAQRPGTQPAGQAPRSIPCKLDRHEETLIPIHFFHTRA